MGRRRIRRSHRLRNVYRPSSKMAAALREATIHAPKLLLTATPLQNSLIERYGLASFVDPHCFGDHASFRTRFGAGSVLTPAAAMLLRERLQRLVTRTERMLWELARHELELDAEFSAATA